MILGKVIGTVWGAKQSEGLVGHRVVEVKLVNLRGMQKGCVIGNDCSSESLASGTILAVDVLGADIGQLVLVAIGSRCRDLVLGPYVTTKHCVIAIVDHASVEV